MKGQLVLFFVFFADIVLQQDAIKTLALLTQPQGRSSTLVRDEVELAAAEPGAGQSDESIVVEFDGATLLVDGHPEPWPTDHARMQAAIGMRTVELRLDPAVPFRDYWQLRTALGEAQVTIACRVAARGIPSAMPSAHQSELAK
jgi:hypothetical protein